MYDPHIHTKGEILEISLDQKITSCIVISDRINRYQLTVGDPVISYMSNDWYTRPKFKNDLVEKNCFLAYYTLEIIFDSYILLYGDQKIWLEYGYMGY